MFPILNPSPAFSPLLYRPVAWYDGSNTPTGAVSSWTDLSGNANHATQGTGSAQPTCTASQLNNKNTLLFDGGDRLNLPSALYTIPNSNNTIFVVSAGTSNTTQQDAIGFAVAGSSRTLIRYNMDGVQNRLGYKSSSDTNLTNAAKFTTSNVAVYKIISAYRSGTTQSISSNNTLGASNTNASNAIGIDGAQIGATGAGASMLTGGIAEILIFNFTLSSTEIIQVNRYLSNKWGITIS